jgi:hypothetical protein
MPLGMIREKRIELKAFEIERQRRRWAALEKADLPMKTGRTSVGGTGELPAAKSTLHCMAAAVNPPNRHACRPSPHRWNCRRFFDGVSK